jgi:hypothetical protein
MGSRESARCLIMLGASLPGVKIRKNLGMREESAPELRDEYVVSMIHGIIFGIFGATCSRSI